jgi:transposase
MSQAIDWFCEQGTFWPHYIEDRIPKDHPARFIKDFITTLKLRELGFVVPDPESPGRPPYGAGLLLSAWLYGYFYRVYSTRGLERVCILDMGAVWLLDWQMPDHNTLWRFIDKNRERIEELFKKVTKTAGKLGQVSLVLQALDGTKIRSKVSTRGFCTKEELEQVLAELDDGMKEVMSEIELQHELDEKRAKLSKDLEDHKRRKVLIERALEELERDGCKQINQNDVDARLIKCGKTIEGAYNAQAVVDEKSGIIVAQDVVNDETDSRQLTRMVEKVEENVGSKPLEVVADSGYYSPEELMNAQAKGFDVLVNIPTQMRPENKREHHKSNFKQGESQDVFICPRGQELVFKGTKRDRHNKEMRLKIYHCQSYKDCPDRDKCSKSKGGRRIEIGPHYEAVHRQFKKQKNIESKEKLSRRKSIVERTFAQIKWNMGFVRFMYSGLKKVKAQFALLCSVYNLKKIYKIWVENKLIFAPI